MVALWGSTEARAELEADAKAVYEVLCDPDTYPEWLVGAQRIRAVDPEFPKPGTGFAHSVGPSEAVTVDDSTTAVSSDPPHGLELDVHAGLLRARVSLSVEPRGSGCEVRFVERPTGPAAALTPLLRPFLHARNARSLRQLGRYMEDVSRRA